MSMSQRFAQFPISIMLPTVNTQEGQVRGFIDKDINSVNFYSFLGIPYAEPPVGKLRFKAPLPKKPWNGILNALIEPPVPYCIQTLPSRDDSPIPEVDLIGSEDCLYLNVFTRKLPKTGTEPLKPVMVFIHGGAFTSGCATRDIYGAGALMSEDVVLVTIQYRLGCFGFLALRDVNLGVTGNAGLKDMVLALKWVQRNIKNFQGDPNNVTIFGQNAGGASVHYLLLSPQTEGLFHKVIAQSGTCLATWAMGRNPNGQILAGPVGFKYKGERKLLDYLQSLTTAEIYEGQQRLQDPSYADTLRYFAPVVEKPSAEAFITEEPLKIISSGNYNKLPIMMGYTAKEGLTYIIMEESTDHMDMWLTKRIVPHDLGLPMKSQQHEEIMEKITNFYNLRNIRPDNRSANEIMDLSTDLYFLKDISLAALLHSKNQNESVYFYKMTADTRLNYFKSFIQLLTEGACYSDELGYLFTNLPTAVAPESIEDITRRRFLKLWTQFARTGNPNPGEMDLIPVEWKPIQNDEFNYLEIGNELRTGVNPDYERVKFWFDIYKSNWKFATYLTNLSL